MAATARAAATPLGEFGRIARFFAPLAKKAPGAAGLQDDCAVLAVPAGRLLVAKSDTIVDTIHLLGDEPPDLVARKALRVNLSDLASKGAEPLGYLLSLSLTRDIDDRWVALFARGLAADQKEFGLALLGGDSTHTPGPVTVTVTMLGTVAAKSRRPHLAQAIARRGDARPGDDVYVTGTIGDGALGLIAARDDLPALSPAERDYLVDRYRLPQPRLAAGRKLAGLVHAAMDISDGLVGDLAHVCKHSGLDATIGWEDVPLSVAGRDVLTEAAELGPQAAGFSAAELRDAVLTGGDDYELLVTAPRSAAPRIARIARDTQTPITRIGRMAERRSKSPQVRVIDAGGNDRTPRGEGGYRHS